MIDSSLSHYKVTAKLGEGGMGEVYRANDTKLGREVAIKVLPASFSRDPQSLGRFEREARALAALNHPHIASIYGFEAERETHFLVLELVEGQTLSERLRQGRIPVDEALRMARQIAEAVEAAHAKGIIHRDLKPGNIKLTPEGRVKVLDFGLAKMEESVRGLATPASGPEAPTLFAETTQPGMVMGTPAYMSPEQARGQEVDKRTDVWAFGCCLFECLSGSKPFRGDTVTDLMAEVLRSEPDWAALPAEVPREVATLLRRCLEKDPRRRLSSLGDIALTLEDSTPSRPLQPAPAAQTESQQTTSPSAKPSFWIRFGPAFAALSVLALVGLAILSVAHWKSPKTAASRASQIRSLAVLPFAFETQDPKLAGLGKWIPAEIRSKLGPLQNLQVVNSPARIEQLVQQRKSEVEIARELGVDGLVMGELHGQGETMSAYVWVVDGSTGRALGRQREIASSASKVSEIPNQVALAIVDELKLQVSTSERTEIGSGETQNAEAFLAVQRGQELFSRRLHDQAAVEFRRAYQLDTNYTRAWVLGAEAELVPLISGGTTNEMTTTFERLSNEVERFRAQRPGNPALASLRMRIAMIFERDWNKVSAAFWDSQRNAKPDASVLSFMSWYYAMIEGHPGHTLHAIEQAIGMAPENFSLPISRGYQLLYFGRFDDAASAFRKLPPEKIPFEDYSRVLLMAGDLTGAKEVATRVLARRPNAWTQCGLAAIHARSGAADEARKILRELETQAEKGMHIPYAQIAWSYGMLGEFESARRWLGKGLLEGHGDWSMLSLRSAEKLEVFGKLAWYWEIIDGMKFPPLQMDNPYFAMEQAMRYGRGTVGTATTGTSTNEPPKTLAVLPLEPLGNWVDTDGLADGLTIALNDSLQKVRGLKVPGWISSMTFKGATNLLSAGRGLQVDHLLAGRVARAGDQLRFSLSLDRTDGGPPLWSTNYDRKQSDIFALQSEIAHQVAGALKLTLGVQERQDLDRKVTDSPEAFDLYLKGRAAWNRRTIPEFERATNFFGQALAKDTNFALAYAALADVHTVWPVYSGEPPGLHSSETIRFARLALEKDPRLAEPHAALGFSLFAHHCDWEGAEREFQAAIRLNPESATAHKWYAELLFILGRPDEALKEAQRSVELDPASQNKDTLGTAMARAGQVDRAVAYFDQLIAAEPSFPNHKLWFFWVLAERGDFERASNVLAQAERDFGRGPSVWKAWLLALQGKAREARELLAQEQKPSGSNVERALVLHALGEDREALDLLEKAVQQRELVFDLTYHLPLWSKLHGDPRFRAVLRSIDLENYIPVPASTNAK